MLKSIQDLPEHFYENLNLQQYLPENLQNINMVLPGDIITKDPLGQFKKLIINPVKSKYTPSVGDIVIGTVLEITNKRWKIEIQSENECYLHLNSTYLPEQRKKTEQDELNMRNLFKEGDILCAEVHSINNDKTVNLHTRSIKYGQLKWGTLIKINSKLMKRQKHHFCKLSNSPVHIIMAHNGNIWLSDIDRNQVINSNDGSQPLIQNTENQQTREQVSRARNVAYILNQENLQFTLENLNYLFEQSLKLNLQSKDILNKNKNQQLMQSIQQKVEEKIPQEIGKLQKQGVYMGF